MLNFLILLLPHNLHAVLRLSGYRLFFRLLLHFLHLMLSHLISQNVFIILAVFILLNLLLGYHLHGHVLAVFFFFLVDFVVNGDLLFFLGMDGCHVLVVDVVLAVLGSCLPVLVALGVGVERVVFDLLLVPML